MKVANFQNHEEWEFLVRMPKTRAFQVTYGDSIYYTSDQNHRILVSLGTIWRRKIIPNYLIIWEIL